MKTSSKLDIQVWAHWMPEGPVLMGILSSHLSRGKELFSFAYADSWLKSSYLTSLDPRLKLFAGEQFNSKEQPNFGVFLDSSPDRWGRVLQKRREAIRARAEERAEKRLLESDFLLGVHDEHRMGALRFKTENAESFLDSDIGLSAPPMTSLRELEAAAWALENENLDLNANHEKWIRLLIAPGGSLGGARPKASVKDENGHLWIAKFPSRNDSQDIGLWELLLHRLAKKAGLVVPEAEARVFKGPAHTFLSKRFDRGEDGVRIHFASAMTLLGKTDGASGEDGSSYLEMAEFLMSSGAQVDQDLEQLWKRIVFSMCVSNTDDHLRNHGFLLTEKGWILSPAYDLNPNPDGEGLKLNVSETDNSQDLDLALEVAPYFRIDLAKAKSFSSDITSTVRDWKKHAEILGISRASQATMSRAFRLANY